MTLLEVRWVELSIFVNVHHDSTGTVPLLLYWDQIAILLFSEKLWGRSLVQIRTWVLFCMWFKWGNHMLSNLMFSSPPRSVQEEVAWAPKKELSASFLCGGKEPWSFWIKGIRHFFTCNMIYVTVSLVFQFFRKKCFLQGPDDVPLPLLVGICDPFPPIFHMKEGFSQNFLWAFNVWFASTQFRLKAGRCRKDGGHGGGVRHGLVLTYTRNLL